MPKLTRDYYTVNRYPELTSKLPAEGDTVRDQDGAVRVVSDFGPDLFVTRMVINQWPVKFGGHLGKKFCFVYLSDATPEQIEAHEAMARAFDENVNRQIALAQEGCLLIKSVNDVFRTDGVHEDSLPADPNPKKLFDAPDYKMAGATGRAYWLAGGSLWQVTDYPSSISAVRLPLPEYQSYVDDLRNAARLVAELEALPKMGVKRP